MSEKIQTSLLWTWKGSKCSFLSRYKNESMAQHRSRSKFNQLRPAICSFLSLTWCCRQKHKEILRIFGPSAVKMSKCCTSSNKIWSDLPRQTQDLLLWLTKLKIASKRYGEHAYNSLWWCSGSIRYLFRSKNQTLKSRGPRACNALCPKINSSFLPSPPRGC